MTPSVTDKTSISAETWRRHTDPPLLWIAVATASVTLHLLLFWLMRSYSFSLALGQHSSAAVPIEFIDLPSSHSLATTPAKPSDHQPSTTRASVSAPHSSLTQENTNLPSPTDEDSNAIAFANKKAIASLVEANKLPKKTIEQKRASTKSKPTSKPVFTSTIKISPQKNLEVRHLSKIHHNSKLVATPSPKPPKNTDPPVQPTPVATEPHPLPPPDTTDPTNTPFPTETPLTTQQQPPLPENDGEAIAQDPTNQLGETPRQAPPPPPKEDTPPTQSSTGGGLVATWDVEGVQQRDRQDTPAKPIGSSREKELNLPSTNGEHDSQPVEFKASLVINKTGHLELIVVDINIPEPQATQYQKYAQEIFKDLKFTPASSNGGEPKKSNIPVRIKIQPKSR